VSVKTPETLLIRSNKPRVKGMKRHLFLCATILLTFLISSPSYAEIVVFAKKYFVDRTLINGELQKYKGSKVQVNIYIGNFVMTFRCDSKWNLEQVARASNSIRNYINRNDDIDPLKMLADAGLSGCNKLR